MAAGLWPIIAGLGPRLSEVLATILAHDIMCMSPDIGSGQIGVLNHG
jgi:hypothetical protein